MKYYLGIDLGGTNIATGVVDENCKIVGKGNVRTELPQSPEAIADKMALSAKLALENANLTINDIQWIGIGTPGIANSETGIVEYSTNFDFYDVPLEKMIEERLGKKAFIENDANAAAYGEYIAGAAKGATKAIAITLGTGVGGGIIIDGKIYSGFNFAGAEIGHIVINHNGRQCNCGRKGCFETYSSATGLIQTTKEYMQKNKSSKLWDIANGSLDNVGGKTAYDGMRACDETAIEIVDEYVNYLACGISNIINIFQPEILVIGGGICKEGDTLLKPLEKIVLKEIYLGKSSPIPKIKIATLGNDAGIIGAAMLGVMHDFK
ncbi:MAG: ROK family glucokinase [Oscillospiraceae bacterium]